MSKKVAEVPSVPPEYIGKSQEQIRGDLAFPEPPPDAPKTMMVQDRGEVALTRQERWELYRLFELTPEMLELGEAAGMGAQEVENWGRQFHAAHSDTWRSAVIAFLKERKVKGRILTPVDLHVGFQSRKLAESLEGKIDSVPANLRLLLLEELNAFVDSWRVDERNTLEAATEELRRRTVNSPTREQIAEQSAEGV